MASRDLSSSSKGPSSSTSCTFCSSLTSLSSMSRCLRRIRLALKKWSSLGRHWWHGKAAAETLSPPGSCDATCTSSSPAWLSRIRTTLWRMRRAWPLECLTSELLPVASSTENSARHAAPSPASNLDASTPIAASSPASASSSRPTGGRTRVETKPSPSCRVTPSSTAFSSVSHAYALLRPFSFSRENGLKPGIPICVEEDPTDWLIWPSTTSLRYTVLIAGYDRDSASSSYRKEAATSSSTLASSSPMSSSTRLAVRRVFSYASFFLPGKRLVDVLLPSLKFSPVSTSNHRCEPACASILSTTTSTTRTRRLCESASCIRRESPKWTSLVNSSIAFVFPWPNWLRSTLCSWSMCLKEVVASASWKASTSGTARRSRSDSSAAFLTSSGFHHS
mmetsp:Transcript_132562/g.412165  ORF Transcript_132562/g.412165 Transcript_132562/m.412165 type:complete len:393 (+) Transcript_132562:261-1439(+)